MCVDFNLVVFSFWEGICLVLYVGYILNKGN